MDKRFGAALNCIDGRTQIPVIQWMKESFGINYLDLITEPGMDKVLSIGNWNEIMRLKNRLEISINAHNSFVAAVVGHYDCAANPVSEYVHIQEIIKSTYRVKSWGLPLIVAGLWVDRFWKVNLVAI